MLVPVIALLREVMSPGTLLYAWRFMVASLVMWDGGRRGGRLAGSSGRGRIRVLGTHFTKSNFVYPRMWTIRKCYIENIAET